MKPYSRVNAIIDLNAIEYNFDQMQKCIDPMAKMVAVIKADGYGHGAIPIAKMMEHKSYIWGYAVATGDEAYLLKKAGLKKPVMILGYTFAEHYQMLIENEIRICVFKKDMAEEISKVASACKKEAWIHFAVDTGMGRIGFEPNEASIEIIKEICALPYIKAEGIFTHFAKADETNYESAYKQNTIFQDFTQKLEQQGVTLLYKHTCNSAGIIRMKDANMDLVRAGISIYGMYPSDEVEKELIDLKPAMSIISHIAYIKTVEAGTEISYGGTFITNKKTKVATIPVGYADGYPRLLSNKGYVLIRGMKAPILGRVCMDQFMVDVTDIKGVQELDKVTLVGNDIDETIYVEDLSALCGRFNYEFVCDVTKRVPRTYIYNNEILEQIDYFE